MNSTELVHHHKYAERILEGLNCPRALTVCIMLRYGDYEGILGLSSEPHNFNDAASFFSHHQATKLLSKATWLPVGIDRKLAAMKKFHEAEKSNLLMNMTLKAVRSGSACWLDSDFPALVARVKGEIRRIVSKEDWLSGLDKCGFGPGADLSTRGQETSAYNKLTGPHSVTRACTKFLDFYVQNCRLKEMFQWDISDRSLICDRVLGNKVTVVPKNAKTDRVIAIEPRWNVYFQKGFGSMLRKCLLRSGQDLSDQMLNQQMALEGSISGELATIDLSSASDSVSLELVRELLPARLTHLLELSRSPMALYEGHWHLNEKFSSMGNGYTFELESLIFLAVARSICGDHKVSVYGDDIIVPSTYSREVLRALYLLGFSPNDDKTFTSGPFRESCGGDFFLGVNVTPVYWKDPLHVQGTLRLVNQVVILARRCFDHSISRDFCNRVREQLAKRLPADLQTKGPVSVSTSVACHSREWRAVRKWGWDGLFIKVKTPIAVKFRYRDYDRAITSQFFQPSSDGYQIRGRVQLKWKTIFVDQQTIITNDELFDLDSEVKRA